MEQYDSAEQLQARIQYLGGKAEMLYQQSLQIEEQRETLFQVKFSRY